MNIAYRQLLPARLRRWLRSLIVECSTPSCRGFHLSHPLLRRLPGIFLNQGWYCSQACVREALEHRVEARRRTAVTDLRQPPRMPLHLVLLAGGRVTEEQLAEARRVQDRVQASGERGLDPQRDRKPNRKPDLGDALVQLGYALEEEVAAARAKEAGYPFYGGDAHPIPPGYHLPSTLLRRSGAAPVHYNPVSRRLLVGFVYRVDSSLLQAVEQVIACRADACIISPSCWSRCMATGPQPHQEVHKRASSQRLIVDLIVEEALLSHADRIAIGLTGTALWARLEGDRRARDLVIDLAEELAGDLAGDLVDNELADDDAPAGEAKRQASQASLRDPATGRGLGSGHSSRLPSRSISLRIAGC